MKRVTKFWYLRQTEHLISARRPDQVKKKKKKKRTCRIVDLAVPADHSGKIRESGKRNKFLDLSRELKKTMEHESGGDTNCGCCTWDNPQGIGKWTGRLGN